VARDLAKKGKKVLILERGGNPKLKGKWWQYALYQCLHFKSLLLTSELLGMVRGIITGGSSVFYYGTSFQVPYDMLKSYGIDIKKDVEEIKREVPIAPLDDDMMGLKANIIMKSARELGYDWNKLDKFMFKKRYNPDQHMAHYYYGDPRDVKWTSRIFVQEAINKSAEIINNAHVKKLLSRTKRL
jgi:hypothetical protein